MGSSVATHVLKMIGLIEKLEKLGFMLHHQLSVDLILQSLPPSFSNFVMNFNLTQVETSTLPELLNMLKTAKDSIGKENTCFHCGKDGNWKRNCKAYLESLKLKKLNEASTSGMFMIEINLSTSKSDSWVLDTGSGYHICINMQGLKKSRKLAKGEVDLRVGNRARVVALAVGIYTLSLPSGLILDLKDCYFVPALTKNIISISCLDLDGFTIITKNKSCSLYRADVFYGVGHLTNGLYILDLENPVFNINTKQPKIDDLTNSYLWHCRLGHINEKRINKLYKNGYLGSFERRNRTLLDIVHSMVSHANLPKSFLGYALNTYSYLLNHAPSKVVDSTPYEIWYKRKPNVKHLKVWGCPAFVKKVRVRQA